MDEHKICFITCVNDERCYEECLYYIRHLKLLEGYTVETYAVDGSSGMASGYNEAMRESNAKFKVYLHQDVFILNSRFLRDCIDIFQSDPKIGMIGMVGSPELPPDGVMWHGRRIGNLYALQPSCDGYSEYRYHLADGLWEVEAVDGLLMATACDLPWREDLFPAWDFYDVSQCFEFRRKGWKIVVPEQAVPWTAHDDGINNYWDYEEARKAFLREYKGVDI